MKKIVSILFIVGFCSQVLFAQNQPEGVKPGTALNDQKKADLLTLETDPAIKNGKVAIIKGVADTSEQRFYIKDLDVKQPVCISVYTDNPKDEIAIKLTKPSWLDVQKEGNTKGKGMCTFRFRTFGEFGIILKAAGGKKNYHLFVWAGDAVKYPMNNVFVSMKDYEKKHSGQATTASGPVTTAPQNGNSNNTLIYIVIGALTVIILLLIIMMMKKKKSGNTLSLILLIVFSYYSTTLKAQPLNPNYTRQRVEQFANDLRQSETFRENTGERLDDLNRLGETLNGLGEDGSHPILDQLHSHLSPAGQQTAAGTMAGAARAGGQLAGAASALHDFMEVWPLLHPDDHDSEPDYTPDGAPEVPTICDSVDNPDACGACFTQSYEHLNHSREVLESLKAIYTRTKKLKKKSIAFGDNVSGMTGVAALAWQQQRVLIVKDYKTFLEHYKTKYNELITGLHTALQEIDACESEHGLSNWYNRFGFMYYDFMKERYAVDADDDEE